MIEISYYHSIHDLMKASHEIYLVEMEIDS